MSKPPRILILSPCTINGFAGNITRFEQTTQLLSAVGNVEFFSLVEDEALHARRLIEWNAAPWSAPRVVKRLLRFAYKSTYVANRLLVEAGFYRHYRFRVFDCIARLILRVTGHNRTFDVLFANYIWTARGFAAVATTSAADLHDIHSDRHKRLGVKTWVDLEPSDEVGRLRECDLAISIAKEEYLLLRSVVDNVVFLPYWPMQVESPASIDRARAAVFVGSMNAVNSDALENISRFGLIDVFRSLRIEIWICGAICSSETARDLAKVYPEGVRLLGPVDDLGSVLRKARFGINLSGPSTGLKIKTVDYLNSGLSVICTAFGADQWLQEVCAPRLHLLPNGRLPKERVEELRRFLLDDDPPDGGPTSVVQEVFRRWSEISIRLDLEASPRVAG